MPFLRKSIPFLKFLQEGPIILRFFCAFPRKRENPTAFVPARPVFSLWKNPLSTVRCLSRCCPPPVSSPIFSHLLGRLSSFSQNQMSRKCRNLTNTLMLTLPQLSTVFHRSYPLWTNLWRLWKSSGYPQFYQSFTHLWTTVEKCLFEFPTGSVTTCPQIMSPPVQNNYFIISCEKVYIFSQPV